MVIFRCTQKLAKRFKIEIEKDLPESSTNTLGDWYFNYFTFERKYYLLGMSEKSLLPVVIPAKEIRDFPERFCVALRELLEVLGIDDSLIARELVEMRSVCYGKTNSRTVLGCQNDCIRMVRYMMRDDPPCSLLEQSLKLSRIPFKTVGYKNPRELTSDFFSLCM
jgi:hypothetical protein